MQSAEPLKRFASHPIIPMGSTLAIFFVLPQYGAGATMMGCALTLLTLIYSQPERFRDRRGSMVLATRLLLTFWIATACFVAIDWAG